MESSGRAERAVARINLEQCRKQAKELVKSFKSGDARALDAIRWNHPRFRRRTDAEIRVQPFVLADAQLVIARTQHIESWPKLLEYLDALERTDSGVHEFERAIDVIVSGDVEALQALLRSVPSLVRQRSTRAHASTLLRALDMRAPIHWSLPMTAMNGRDYLRSVHLSWGNCRNLSDSAVLKFPHES